MTKYYLPPSSGGVAAGVTGAGNFNLGSFKGGGVQDLVGGGGGGAAVGIDTGGSGGGVSVFCLFGYTSEGNKGSMYGRDFRLSRTTIPRSKAGRDSSKPAKTSSFQKKYNRGFETLQQNNRCLNHQTGNKDFVKMGHITHSIVEGRDFRNGNGGRI